MDTVLTTLDPLFMVRKAAILHEGATKVAFRFLLNLTSIFSKKVYATPVLQNVLMSPASTFCVISSISRRNKRKIKYFAHFTVRDGHRPKAPDKKMLREI
jgi:hypothetical protein